MQPPSSYGGNALRSLSRMVEDVRFDLNRNTLQDRYFYHNKSQKYYHDLKDKNMTRPPYVIRNHIMSRMAYTPYPSVSPSTYYKAPPTERNEYMTEQNGNIRSGYHFDHIGEYCAELLNRDKHYWTDEETGLMLELYEENRDYFTDSKTKKTKIWSVIANIVNKRFNTNVNSEQCSQKYRNLKAEFLKIADPTSFDGGARKFGRHFRQMKRLLEAEEKYLRSHQTDWIMKEEVLETSDANINSTTVVNHTKLIPSSNNPLVNYNEPVEKLSPLSSGEVSSTGSSTNTSPVSETSGNITDNSTATEEDSERNISKQSLGDSSDENGEKSVVIRNTDISVNTQSSDVRSFEISTTDLPRPAIQQELSVVPDTQTQITSNLKDDDNKANIDLNNADKMKTENNEVLSEKSSESKYTQELSYVFHEYFLSRSKALEIYEHKQKENIVCMNKCIEVFRKVLHENIF